MTATNQDFTTYQGDSAVVIFTVTDASGAPIDISSAQQIEWTAARNLQSIPVVDKTKTGGGIAFVTTGVDGKFEVLLAPADTQAMTGRYIFEAILTDNVGNVSTVATGVITVGRAPIATYSGDPANSPVDAVRFYIQDTDTDAPMIMDAEISFVLQTYSNPILAAAQCCRALAAKFAQKVSKRVGDLSINFSDKAKQYLLMAEDLEVQGSLGGIAPYSGGISISDKQAVCQDGDRVRPPFREKEFDNHDGLGGVSTYDPNTGQTF